MGVRAWGLVLGLMLAGLTAPATGQAAPQRYQLEAPDAERDAIGILEQGHEYLSEVEFPEQNVHVPPPLSEIDRSLAYFLQHPSLQPAVQFGCVRRIVRREERVIAALDGDDDAVSLLALAALVRVQSPSSVEQQLATLKRLEAERPDYERALKKVRARFSKKVVAKAIAENPPADRYERANALSWSIRAAGSLGYRTTLPRLASLCVSDHLRTSLAAERSIEDFTGPKAEAALASCVRGWRYNAADRAFSALAERNEAFARETLLAIEVPADKLGRYADKLVTVANLDAVPRLIEIIPELEYPNDAIRALEDNALPRHWAVIADLALRVDGVEGIELRELAERLKPLQPFL